MTHLRQHWVLRGAQVGSRADQHLHIDAKGLSSFRTWVRDPFMLFRCVAPVAKLAEDEDANLAFLELKLSRTRRAEQATFGQVLHLDIDAGRVPTIIRPGDVSQIEGKVCRVELNLLVVPTTGRHGVVFHNLPSAPYSGYSGRLMNSPPWCACLCSS